MQKLDPSVRCIVVPPPGWPGPPGPKFPPVIIWEILEDGGFRVSTSQSIPLVKDVVPLDAQALTQHTVAGGKSTSSPDDDSADAAGKGGDDYKPDPPKLTKREALLIQSRALEIASKTLALQSEAVNKQLAALDSPSKDSQ